MPSFNIEVPHQQSREAVTEKLKEFARIARADLPTGVSEVSEQWRDDGTLEFGFKAMGMSLTGQMTVVSDLVSVKGTMPFAALPFRGALEGQIRKQVEKALA